jgi:hypothetical protein
MKKPDVRRDNIKFLTAPCPLALAITEGGLFFAIFQKFKFKNQVQGQKRKGSPTERRFFVCEERNENGGRLRPTGSDERNKAKNRRETDFSP